MSSQKMQSGAYVLSVRMRPKAYALVKATAAALGKNTSDVVREILMEGARKRLSEVASEGTS